MIIVVPGFQVEEEMARNCLNGQEVFLWNDDVS